MQRVPRILVLSAGYGMGHHAAAHALEEEFCARGWEVRFVDLCAESCPVLFELTRRFYHFCVRKAPWLWRIAYEQTDNSDWRRMLRLPALRSCTKSLGVMLDQYRPDVCVCTYPVYAHMLDEVNARRKQTVPYALVVTDSLEISRPWATSSAPLVCVPDAESRCLLLERYGLHGTGVISCGFPVRSAFRGKTHRSLPSEENLQIVYGAFAPLQRVKADVQALLDAFRGCRIILLAAERAAALRGMEAAFAGRLQVLDYTADMALLFSRCHLYIGKAGASTMFEAYASGLPMIVNYALPGQEQGNLQRLLADSAGYYAGETETLLHTVRTMLANGAQAWSSCAAAMLAARRSDGAASIAEVIGRRFL